MIGIIKQVLFKSALVVILLHTLISHKHYDEMSEIEHSVLHQNSDDLLDLLVLFFHESNDDSIDDLVFAQFDVKHFFKYSIASSALLSSLDSIYFDPSNCLKILNKSTSIFISTSFVKLNGLRGPPSFLFSTKY